MSKALKKIEITKLWKAAKTAALTLCSDKESKSEVEKFYKEFDLGLSPKMAKVENSKTVPDMVKAASEALNIIKVYNGKISNADIPAKPALALGGALNKIQKELEGTLVYLAKAK